MGSGAVEVRRRGESLFFHSLFTWSQNFMHRFRLKRASCIWLGALASCAVVERTAIAQVGSPPDPPGPPALAPTPATTTESAAPPPAPTPLPDAKPSAPFAFGDFSWLNGENRQSKSLLDSPIFTGSFLLDVNYTASANNPIDNTVVGSTALSRNNEITLAFMGFGGDFHYEHARARMMTQFGVRSELVPRNDFSTFHGQFDLQNALRYVSEANGGYHWDALHGINLDAGIFMSYVGLFSFDNFENWMYLPSFTSDNTPWFFNGLRMQIFPTDTLKIEPWFINGWQTYGKFNEMPGFGAQFLFRPVEWFSILSNDYWGFDAQDLPGLNRWHSDNSAQLSYYHHPRGFVTRLAGSFTFDIGGEFGDGVSFGGHGSEGHCTTSTPCAARFVSGMTYQRAWFGDKFAFTVGGGFMSQPEPLSRAGADGQRVGRPAAREHPGHPVCPADERLRHELRHALQRVGLRVRVPVHADRTVHLRHGIQPSAGGHPVLRGPRRRDLARRLHHDHRAGGLAAGPRQGGRPDHRRVARALLAIVERSACEVDGLGVRANGPVGPENSGSAQDGDVSTVSPSMR